MEPSVEEISHVFTPARPASKEVFAERTSENLQARVIQALRDPGLHVVLYGPTGVGKTSLVHNVCAGAGLSKVGVNAGGPFNRMLTEVLALLDPSAVISEEVLDGGGASLSVGLAKFQDHDEVRRTTQPRHVSLIRQVYDALVRTDTHVLFIDNFESLDDQGHREATIGRLAEMLKFFSDSSYANKKAPKVVIAGIASSSAELVRFDQAVARRTLQAKVPRMTPDEILTILKRGSGELNVQFDDSVTHAVVQWSDGLPYVTHSLAKHATVAAANDPEAWIGVLRKRLHVGVSHFEAGVHAAVATDLLYQRQMYEAATREQPRRQLAVSALAQCKASEVTFKDARLAYREAAGADSKVDSRQIKSLFKRLSEEGDHPILACHEVPRGQTLYRFRDPLMRAYVRLLNGYGFNDASASTQ
jgi:hypothetical protein